MVTINEPLTWGLYDEPPADIPECGFVGELCPPPIQGKSITESVSLRQTKQDDSDTGLR